nr:M18 family aminopeptidase [Treponema sp.]
MEKKYLESSRNLLDFIEKSPSCFHVVKNFVNRLLSEGFTELMEDQPWKIVSGGKYFVRRNASSLIAFAVSSMNFENFQIAAAHSDSPTFKIKENPEIALESEYVKLNVEKYGGMICSPWFDRPLSVAGKISVRTENGFDCRLVNIDRDLLLIPNLAIHMDRSVNEGHSYNVQTELLPLFGGVNAKDTFLKIVAESAGVKPEEIIGTDLFLYNRQKGSVWGAQNEFISSAKLDDLQSAYALVEGLICACGKAKKAVPVVCVFDNEEVGSTTKQGADSSFLSDTLERICINCKSANWQEE